MIATYQSRNDLAYRRNAIRGLGEVLRFARPRRVRSLVEFAEAELRYPTGRFAGERFNRAYQPATALLLDELSTDRWRQTFVVGPHQGGKSFAIIAWLMHCLFERQEDVIFGLPDLTMRGVKWRKDILPLIQASRYRDLLPTSGAGSQGGVADLIKFANGVSLLFLGAGGGDTQRAGATARNLIVSEANAFGVRGGSSEESSKWSQILGRVSHFAGIERVIAESTVTTPECLVWSNYQSGTSSVVVVQCHSCGRYVAPERDDFVGWQDAKTEDQARDCGRFSCSGCGILWSEDERLRNLQTARLQHAGQTIGVDGVVVGPVPPTRKLGFRFGAATNAFADAGSIAVEEWTRSRIEDPKARADRDRELNQFRFAVPHVDDTIQIEEIDGRDLLLRTTETRIGYLPDDTVQIFGGVDVRKTQVHWSVVAFRKTAGPQIVAWGWEPVAEIESLDVELVAAIAKVQDRFREGFTMEAGGEFQSVDFTLVDAGWKTSVVQQATERDVFVMPSMGFGSGILSKKSYRTPRSVGKTCRLIGDGFNVALVGGRWLVELDANYWKARLRESLVKPVGSPEGMTFAAASDRQLRDLINHLLSESPEVEFIGGESVIKFGEPRGENHWLDATYLALAARSVDDDLRALLEADQKAEEPEGQEWSPGSAWW